MKEKQFRRWLIIRLVILIALYLVVNTVMGFVLGRDLTDPLFNLNQQQELYLSQLADMTIRMDRSDLLTVRGPEVVDGKICLLLEPATPGDGQVFIEVVDPAGKTVDMVDYKVVRNGLIIDGINGNFSHYRERQLCITLFLIALAVLLWMAYFKASKELVFSYYAIFCIGLGMWVSLISVILMIHYVCGSMMMQLYNTLTGASGQFAIWTFPLIFVFALLLSISNISLIRHEGFRFRNALGILISLCMVVVFVVLLMIDVADDSGSETYFKIKGAILEFLYCIYVILECFLLGSVVCGTRAARHQPAYDKDYIVILGCMIRKDGTLFPLIRGRVDRAIRFYQEQLERTGKKAVFMPSGGQGKNEPTSEAAAMRRYLLEQGIAPEQIQIEDQSVNTRQNMQFSQNLIGEGKKAVFSTTNYHVFRSGIISRQVGFEAEGMGSHTKWYFWPNAYVREVIGMLSYKWRSLIILLIPIVSFLTVLRFTF